MITGYYYSNKGFLPDESTQSLRNRAAGKFERSDIPDLGYFAGDPAIIESTQEGVLLFDGSIYNQNTSNLSDSFSKNPDSCIELIKSFRGEYSLTWVTEEHIVFCNNEFGLKNLWFYCSIENRVFTIASVPDCIRESHETAWRVRVNKIYVLDRSSFSIKMVENTIWDLEQKTNNYDLVWEKFETAVRDRHIPGKTTYPISSGLDSGSIACAAQKLFKDIDVVHCRLVGEDEEVLKARLAIHDGKMWWAPQVRQGHLNELVRITHDREVVDVISTSATISMIKDHMKPRGKEVLIWGHGADEFYSDYAIPGQPIRWFSTFGGFFPDDLRLVWPWSHEDFSPCDTICGDFGIDSRFPIYDIDLAQAWLNTTAKLKNTGWKDFLHKYLIQNDYPFTLKKVSWWAGSDYTAIDIEAGKPAHPQPNDQLDQLFDRTPRRRWRAENPHHRHGRSGGRRGS